ncbi:MAG: bifunctional diaminohydroxyphosphoribosylaminopyrimidine deaminase/5-amino-6-(5-phosphoribosylamino)uracil reductase RibD, partial [Planctomycetota bacterium]
MSRKSSHSRDEGFMARALELARKSLGRASPNPAVGAVVVKDGEVAGEGFHETFGGPHAEVVAIKAAGERAKDGTLYVSLEPCRHEGKTPPCTDAILRAGIARVVYACADPNPEAAGGGAFLGGKGVEVVEFAKDSAPAVEARDFYAYFFKHILRGRPFVTAKWAMTADGRLGTRTGDSRWVSSDE